MCQWSFNNVALQIPASAILQEGVRDDRHSADAAQVLVAGNRRLQEAGASRGQQLAVHRLAPWVDAWIQVKPFLISFASCILGKLDSCVMDISISLLYCHSVECSIMRMPIVLA